MNPTKKAISEYTLTSTKLPISLLLSACFDCSSDLKRDTDMAYGERLKRGADCPMSLMAQLQLILENSHNAYTFRYRCKGLQIIIEKMPDGNIVASCCDGRNDRITIDVTQAPFDKLLRFL